MESVKETEDNAVDATTDSAKDAAASAMDSLTKKTILKLAKKSPYTGLFLLC